MNRTQLFFSSLILLICIILGQQIISISLHNQEIKHDYAEINHIKYGLFSINEWKRQLSEIIEDEVADFDIGENKKDLKPVVESQLNKLIDEVQKHVEKENQKTVKGRIKQAVINTLVNVRDIKEGVPKYADEMIKLISKPKIKKNIKGMLLDKVGTYFEKTFNEQDLSPVQAIVVKFGVSNVEDAKAKISKTIAMNQERIFIYTWVILGLTITLFLIAEFSKGAIGSTMFVYLVISLLILLASGVTTPMIDLEAKISEMSFVLLDHPVKFINQILYFQTKSVADVFWLMMIHPDIQMKIVGILMVMFSIAFPLAKLFSCLFYYYDYFESRKSKVINFFVQKSGKWSMTDVLIIAIFMAYIGFNGIVSSQFGKLHSGDEEIVLLTTNGTSLQPGFYLFLGYALLSLFLSDFLTRKFSKPMDVKT